MTINAADIRGVTNKAITMQQLEEQQRKSRETHQRNVKRANIMLRSRELFEEVLEEIKKEADAGRNTYRYHYGEDTRYGSVSDEGRFKADAIDEEARNRGFKTSFKHEDSNMGDSAAPCFITQYWLEIGW